MCRYLYMLYIYIYILFRYRHIRHDNGCVCIYTDSHPVALVAQVHIKTISTFYGSWSFGYLSVSQIQHHRTHGSSGKSKRVRHAAAWHASSGARGIGNVSATGTPHRTERAHGKRITVTAPQIVARAISQGQTTSGVRPAGSAACDDHECGGARPGVGDCEAGCPEHA